MKKVGLFIDTWYPMVDGVIKVVVRDDGKPYFVSNLSARARLSSFPTSTSWSPGTATP